MAKNIELMGAVFPDVPSIKLPQYGGGLVSFDDTSDADAVAGDIAQGKTAYVNGVKVVGTNQGGGGGDEPEPTDGKTHIWIHIDTDTPANRLTFPLYFGQSVANGVTVDWGDGSATETFAGTSATVHNHTYATGGDYEITLGVTDGTLKLTGTSNASGYAIYGLKSSPNYYNRSRIRRVHIGNGVTSIDGYAFENCYSLTRMPIPDSVMEIGTRTFYNCYGLTNITIPDSVMEIGTNVFNGCYGIAEYHLLSTTPPTLANTNAFNGIATDCIIYVPYSEDHSILEAYKTATNWSTYASKMQEEPA